MDLTAPVTSLLGVGSVQAKKLAKLDITTVFELLYHLPFRYEDRSQVSAIGLVQPGEALTITGQIQSFKNQYTRNRKTLQTAVVTDTTGQISVMWFNQPFLGQSLKTGISVSLHGKIDRSGSKLSMISPDYEIIRGSSSPLHTGRVVPVYPETAGISSKWLRSRIYPLLNTLSEPDPWPTPNQLPSWKTSLNEVHFPSASSPDIDSLTSIYRKRLAYDELFLLSLGAAARRKSWKQVRLSHTFSINESQIQGFISKLPFTLTSSQNQSIKEILSDLSSPHPMNRLLEGDVGSGKTVVAAIAAYVAYVNGFTTLILAPTQILASQHHSTLSGLFRSLGISVDLVLGGKKATASSSPIIIGTHALLSASKAYSNVGLVVIDEQHRFGVAQRALAAQKGASPHILTMTATPIPRSLALAMHGDLDLSLLSEVPSGRLPIKTWVVPESKRTSSYSWIQDQILTHKSQCFWVCPFIEDSETITSVKSATSEFEKLKAIFPNLKLGLLHGKLKLKDKDAIIAGFRAGDYHILVSTPVVEVGIDIPNSSIMVIEGADRFGLAQLHQLRGRVGRGTLQSYCLLFSSSTTDLSRLKALEKHSSGLELAEMDLSLRGPGTLYNTAQAGHSQFKIASYTDLDLLETAKSEAESCLNRLESYPVLNSLLHSSKIELVNPN